MDKSLRMGIVGAGMIADVIAGAIELAKNAELAAIASRRRESAEDLAKKHGISVVFDTWEELVTSDRVDAVYISTPTSVREGVAIAAAKNEKHVLAEKPFAGLESVQRIVQATRENGVAFMDATHFVHHPRTKELQARIGETVGCVQAVRSSFFFPFSDRTNIRFDPEKEPSGAVGDMGWYSMRAITEYMQDRGEVSSVCAGVDCDEVTGAVIRGAGVVVFGDKKTSTFDFGYNAGVCLMDLDLLGTRGMVHMDDFVLDWARGFPFDNPDFRVGYTLRSGIMTPDQFRFVPVNHKTPQAVHMIEDFVRLAENPDGEMVARSIRMTVETQGLLDQVRAQVV